MNNKITRTKLTGERFLVAAFKVETPEGTVFLKFIVRFYRGGGYRDHGIQGSSSTKWEIPTGYSFYVPSLTPHNLVGATHDKEGHCNYVGSREIQGNKMSTDTARLETPFGTVDFKININYAHRRQHITVFYSDFPAELPVEACAY